MRVELPEAKVDQRNMSIRDIVQKELVLIGTDESHDDRLS